MVSIKRQIVEEIHAPARVNFPRRKLVVKSINDLFQSDLAEFIPYANTNNGYKYILFVINVFTKVGFCEALKSKTGGEVTTAMNKILSRTVPPKNLWTDHGSEYYNTTFQNLMKKYNINHYSTFSTKKAMVCENLIKKFKRLLYQEFSYRGSYKWIDIYQGIMEKINKTPHRTIGMRPLDVKKRHEKHLLKTVYTRPKILKRKIGPLYKENDYVRISRHRHVFSKSYLPQWTTEVFKIYKVQHTIPQTYLLQDLENQKIQGAFYGYEIKKTNIINEYLVEKVIKRRGNKLLVKWLGFSDAYNSEIDVRDLIV
jgi:hypothetical protein